MLSDHTTWLRLTPAITRLLTAPACLYASVYNKSHLVYRHVRQPLARILHLLLSSASAHAHNVKCNCKLNPRIMLISSTVQAAQTARPGDCSCTNCMQYNAQRGGRWLTQLQIPCLPTTTHRHGYHRTAGHVTMSVGFLIVCYPAVYVFNTRLASVVGASRTSVCTLSICLPPAPMCVGSCFSLCSRLAVSSY